ncbi:hypothetical protein BY996DRAFT_6408196 [Phakopsora pachyrhizi]|nr:hypothetical protein BY996DRAFT_6408196 [Phakopsora pachyrhizi]
MPNSLVIEEIFQSKLTLSPQSPPEKPPLIKTAGETREMQIENADLEEISSIGAQLGTIIDAAHLSLPSGSNSVLFPDWKTFRNHESLSPLRNSESSVSTWKPFSSTTTSNASFLHQRGLSTNTSLTSLNSFNLARHFKNEDGAHTVRLISSGSAATPRIRHTKLLGTPRASSRTSTLSTSSLNSDSRLDAINAGEQARSMVRGSASLTNLSLLHPNPRIHQEDESECLAPELTERKRVSRPKVPLSEIIGGPSMSQLTTAPVLQSSSSSDPSINLGTFRQIQSPFQSFSTPMTSQDKESISTEEKNVTANGESAEKSSDFSVTNTSSSLDTLRSQVSNAILIHSVSRPSTPDEPQSDYNVMRTDSLPKAYPRQDAIVEVDEDDEGDGSFEFLEKEEALAVSPQTAGRKRKRRLCYGELHHFGRQGLAAIEISSSKLIDLLPYQSKIKHPRKSVLEKLGLSRSLNFSHSRAPSSFQSGPKYFEADVSDANPLSPTKKIRILESEISRLRQELESERVKNNIESVKSPRNNNALSRSINSPGNHHSVQRVKFSPRCSLPTSARSPNFSSASERQESVQQFQTSPTTFSSPSLSSIMRSPKEISLKALHTQAEFNASLSDSPVVVKKPSEGALVGGSPFIVSRVYGKGPEVTGERTPVIADKWSRKHKSLSASVSGIRVPGLAQDLFGAKSSIKGKIGSCSGEAVHYSRSGRMHEKSTSKVPASNTQSLVGGSISKPDSSIAWCRDGDLDSDLFGTIKQPSGHLFEATDSTAILAKEPLAPLSPSKLQNASRSSSRNQKSCSTSGVSKFREGSSEQSIPEMATFLSELKSAGRDKLRKTMGSIKYYNATNSSEQNKSPHQSSQSRLVNPANAEILQLAIKQEFSCSPRNSYDSRTLRIPTATTKLNGSGKINRRSIPAPISLDDGHCQRTSNNSPIESPKSPLFQRIYPSSSTKESRRGMTTNSEGVQVVLGQAISTPKTCTSHLSRSIIDPGLTPRARNFNSPMIDPSSPIQKDFTMDELIEQVSSLRQTNVVLTDTQSDMPPRTRQDSFLRKRELVQEMGLSSSAENSFDNSSLSKNDDYFTNKIPKQVQNPQSSISYQARPRSSPILKNVNKNRPMSPSKTRFDTGRHSQPQRLTQANDGNSVRLVSILTNSSRLSTDESYESGMNKLTDITSSNSRSSSKSKRVVIVDEPNYSQRRSSSKSVKRSSVSSTGSVAGKRFNSIKENEGEGSIEVRHTEKTDKEVPEPTKQICQPSKDAEWVLVKSDCNRLGNGEANLRRWSLRASAIMSANPKLSD